MTHTTPYIATRIDPLYCRIGERIREERDELGFSQIDLATEIGLTRTSIVNIEAGSQSARHARAATRAYQARAGASG